MVIPSISNPYLNEDLIVLDLPEVLDESFSFDRQPRLFEVIQVDGGKVKKVRAEGLKKLIEFFRSQDPRIQFVFTNIPFVLAKSLGQTQGAYPQDLRVQSIAWPMECQDCEHYDVEWLERGKDFLEAQSEASPATLRLPELLNCRNCQGMMESTEDERVYLRFLYSQDVSNEAE